MKDNIWGDIMSDFQMPNLHDDQLLEEMQKHVSPLEVERNLVFSKNGIVKYIEEMLKENDPFSDDKKVSKMWESKLKNANQHLHLKKDQNDCPFMRSEVVFEKKFKMQKIANCVYGQEEKMKWDANFVKFNYTPFGDMKHCGLLYTMNKK